MASDGPNKSATASPATNAPSTTTNGATKAGNGTATPNGTGAGDLRGQTAVSVAKGPVHAAKGEHSINFGSVHDQNAMLSSSPAAQPSSGHQPAKFGSLAAASGEGGKKVVGFPGKGNETSEGGGNHSLKRSMDFNKLFQGGGSSAASSNSNASPALSSANAAAAPTAATAGTNGSNASNASVDATSSAGRNAPSSNLRPPSAQSRPFEQAQRSPSASHATGAGARNASNPASGGPASSATPFHPGANAHQQPRSPPLAQQSGAMPPYPSMAGAPPQWQQHQQQHPQQQPMPYFQPGYPGYGYPPGSHHPQQMHQQWHAQAGYDMSGQMQPRSPRHMPASPMGAPNHQNGLPSSMSSSSLAGHGSPASQRTQQSTMPHTPSSQASSMTSPPSAAAYSMGMGRPSGFAGQFAATHSPSHSFSSATGGPQMSPTARNFEFGKRTSSAIRIVNPETKATIDPRAAGGDHQSSATPPPPSSTTTTTSTTPSADQSTTANASAVPAAQGTPTPAHASPAATAASPAPKQAAAAAPSPAKQRPESSAKLETPDSFMARVKAAAAENKRKKEAAEEEERAAAAKKAEEATKAAEQEEEARKQKAREEEEKVAAAKKQQEEEAEKARKEKEAEEKAAREKEESEARAKAEAEAEAQRAKAKADADAEAEVARKAKEEADAKARKTNEEAAAAAASSAKAAADSAAGEASSADKDKKRPPAPIDTSKASSSTDEDFASRAVPSVSTPGPFRNSAADVERMAREASSVPSTPLEPGSARLPPVPSTPRTPGTPGFANLPAKPMSTLTPTSANVTPSGVTSAAAAAAGAANNNGIKLDSEALERKKRTSAATPSQLDVGAADSPTSQEGNEASGAGAGAGAGAGSEVSQSTALGSARFIDDLKQVQYPDKIQSPKPELNESAEPGKFRYDRDFLLQFMGVYKDKPMDLPLLSSIGMDSSQAAGGARGMPNRRASGMGPPIAPGRPGVGGIGLGLGAGGAFGGAKGMGAGGMGSFSHTPKTSEERFAASNARSGGAFGSSGPMGSFNAGARSQPLSRTGSGSNALPSRDMMGTNMPTGGRTKSNRGRQREVNSRGPHVNPPEKGGPTIPMDQVAPLAMSDNRWQGSRGQNIKPDSPELVNRKVKALLNKLTVEKFESISDQIIEWANKSVNETDGQTLRQVIALIFEKATDEAAWSEMYARLCRKIMEKLDPNIADENIKTSDDKPVTGGQLFRKYLVNRCQEDYERGWAQKDAATAAAKSKEAEDKAKLALNEQQTASAKEAEARGEKVVEKEAELMSEEYYEAQKAKRRGLGLVRFIGELYKLLMITEKIMHLCVRRLLANAQDPEEDEIESLCKLLTTIGKQLDTGKATGHVDVYFQRIQQMNFESMNSRMRFMLQDVIELRQQNWKPRHDNAAPKTIAQIHEDAAKAKAEAEAEQYARQSGRGMGGPVSRGGSRRGQQRGDYGGGAVGVDGWSTVGGNQPPPPPRQAKAGDLSGFGKGIDRSSTAGKPFAVGPQSVFAKKNQRGSEDGSNPPSRTNSTTNMFSLLNQQSGNEAGEDASAGGAGAESSGRPKLNLAPRTKPLPDAAAAAADGGEEESTKADAAAEEEAADISDEEAKRKITNDVKEFLEIKDISEGRMALESLPSKRRPEFLSSIADVVLNKHEDEVRLVGELLASSRKEGLLVDEMVEQGFKDQIEFLDDVAIDVPNAYSYMAILLAQSGLPREKVEALAKTIQGEGIKPPSEKLMQKVDEELAK